MENEWARATKVSVPWGRQRGGRRLPQERGAWGRDGHYTGQVVTRGECSDVAAG